MSDGYHLDPHQIDLQSLRDSLTSRPLIPSRRMLLDDLDRNFEALAAAGIGSLGDLIVATKTKPKLARLAERTSVPRDYLTVLRREANSYLPNPVPLRSLPGVAPADIEPLAAAGIKNTRTLLARAHASKAREQLADESGVSMDVLVELCELSDLCRLYGVGPAFARLLHGLGIRSAEHFAEHRPEQIVALYEDKTGGKADFSAADVSFTLEMAQFLLRTQ